MPYQNRLSDLANKRMLDEYAMASDYGNAIPDNQLASLIDRGGNFIRNDQTGQVIELGQSRPEAPRFAGSPVDVFGQGRGYLDPSTGLIQGVNKQGQQFRVQPSLSPEDIKLQTQKLQMQKLQKDIQGGDTGTPYFTPLQTAKGVMMVNARTGEMKPAMMGNEAIIGAQADPLLQQKLAESKGIGKELGKASGSAKTGLDQTVFQGNETIKMIDELVSHPGFKSAVGVGSEVTAFAPSGSETRNFLTRLDQLKGGQFLQAFQTLKGGGQITEIEGKKATDAISRMNTAVSEPEFIAAANDFRDVIKAGVDRAKRQAQGDFGVGNMPYGQPNQDAEAIAWANSNPNDPRAQQILRLHGM